MFALFVFYINWNHKDTSHPREGGWIQPYVLIRMLVRPVNLNFWKSGECGFFLLKKTGNVSLNTDILKLQKIGIHAISRLSVSIAITRCFWVCFRFIGYLMPAYSFSSILPKMSFIGGDLRKLAFFQKCFEKGMI